MCGHTRDPIIYSEFHRNPFRGFGAPGGQNLAFPITLASRFYNSLYYRTSRDNWSDEKDISCEIRNLFVRTNMLSRVLVHVHLMLKLCFLEVSVFVFMVLRYGGSIAIHCIIGSSHATTNA